jgi:DNA ligase (NAD+)
LDKTKDIIQLKNFLADKEGMLSFKLDGLTIVCTYENGQLVRAVTRGNGEIGEEVTSNAKTFSNLPLTIPYQETLILRGEALILYSDFNRINEKLPIEEQYKNPRNLCSGSVRQLDPRITKQRHVQYHVFAIVEGGPNYKTKIEDMQWLVSQGFEVAEYKEVTAQNLEDTVKFFEQTIPHRDFASDGLVLTYNDKAYSKSLGATAKFPKDAIAFKWQDEKKETTIKMINWHTSRTGLINPVAVFEPVELEGTTVERASVHNVSVLENLKLGIGDTVTIYKANMIIPQIAENLTQTGPDAYPSQCPICGCETVIKQDKTAKTLYCPNGNCPAQRLKALVHFVSRDAMNIEGLSEATIEKFIQQGFLNDPVSFYHLTDFSEMIQNMEGFGKKSYDNMITAIEKSRKTVLSRVIYALGILQVGPMNAKLICKHFKDDIMQILQAQEQEFLQIEGIGPVIAREVFHYFNLEANRQMVLRLLKELELEKMNYEVTIKNAVTGKSFVITGDVHHFKNRKELQEKIESLGGKVVGSVSKKTDYLINNDSTSTSGKNQKAQALGIPILTEEDFLVMLEE